MGFLIDGERAYNDPEEKWLTGVHIGQAVILTPLMAVEWPQFVHRSIGCAPTAPQSTLRSMVVAMA